MTDYRWRPGWYAAKLHAQHPEIEQIAMCGLRFPAFLPDKSDWFVNAMKKITRCKKCERAIEKENENV